jgi:hypothetical protein
MPYVVNGIKVGKLKIILLKEKIKLTQLHIEMIKQCESIGIKSATYPELSNFAYGDKPDTLISKYLKIINALNVLRKVKEEPYTLSDLVDVDEVLKPKNKKQDEQKGR